jgi:Protein of unknown function (DUF1501)
MLRILGSSRRLCDRVSRRDVLRIGSVGFGSLALGDLLALQKAQAANVGGSTFGRAKRIILLYLYGAAAQHETFDPKPAAPAEIRGEFRPIATAVPGVSIGEHLPKIAKIADRVTLLRSMTHPYNIHSAAYTLTGIDRVDIPMELNPYDTRHWPFFGSVLEYVAEAASFGGDADSAHRGKREVPSNIALPYLFSSRCPEFDRGGPYGGFLGRTYNPVWTEFEGKSSRTVKRWRGDQDNVVPDPYAGVTPESRFVIRQAGQLQPGVTLDRLNRRRSLLNQLDSARRRIDSSPATKSLDRYQQMAWSLITSQKLRDALDVGREKPAVRERYGMTLFGQATLAGRRLLEAGATLVSVFWDEYGPANTAWDTHFNHYERLKGELLPGLDGALSALIGDLEQRGMLDDTLVMCLTEHGRTPKITLNTPRGVGREHWSNVYSNLLAGGGIARGKVIGSSDREGAFVKSDPVSPKDVLCTMYHLMGVDPHRTLTDNLGRRLPLVYGGKVLRQALG